MMMKEIVNDDLKALACDFFYEFSRFEFTLKERGYLKNEDPGRIAAPSWENFISEWSTDYILTHEAKILQKLNPKQQVVGTSGGLEFKEIDFTSTDSELKKTIRLLKTTRNNLFHGGKHGRLRWHNPKRTKKLLSVCIIILEQLTNLAFKGDN